jgi:hypothetical protein
MSGRVGEFQYCVDMMDKSIDCDGLRRVYWEQSSDMIEGQSIAVLLYTDTLLISEKYVPIDKGRDGAHCREAFNRYWSRPYMASCDEQVEEWWRIRWKIKRMKSLVYRGIDSEASLRC